MGARDIFAFEPNIDFYRKIAQMLHSRQFRDTHGLSITVLFSDHAAGGMEITWENVQIGYLDRIFIFSFKTLLCEFLDVLYMFWHDDVHECTHTQL